MSDSYLSTKISEALKATGGDKKDAQKLMITWAVRDPALLLGLTKPHLKAIVATHLDHAIDSGSHKKAASEKDHFTSKDVAKMVASKPLGEKRAHAAPPPKTSVRQATVMQQIADAFKKKKSD